MQLIEIIKKLESSFPKKDAAKWDFVGWQVKTKDKELEINNILISLDITEAVINQAIEHNIRLIICHHPFIFAHSINALNNNKFKKQLYQKLVANDINVFVLHTNFDKNPQGMSFLMAQDLKLNQIKYFDPEKFSVIGQYNDLPLNKVIEIVKEYYQFDKVKVISNDLTTKINKVIVAAGAGGIIIEYLNKSINPKKDISLVITGEMKWHQELEARDKNINVLILGHEMEEKFVDFISDFLINQVFKTDTIKLQKYLNPKAKII